MKTDSFLAGAAKAVFVLAAVMMMSSVFTACSKDNNDDDDAPVITATTSKAVGETIEISFDKTDAPEVEGLEKVKEEPGDKWNVVTYKVVSQTFRVKGEIKRFYVNRHGLTNVAFTPSSRLSYVDLYENQLSSLDVSMLPELDTLYCSYNNLKTVGLTHNPKLRFLGCTSNQITRLDLTQNTALIYVGCTKNKLKGTTLKLPRVTSGELRFKDEAEGDTQTLSPDEVAAYKALNWKVYKFNAANNKVDYEGE